MSSENQKYCVVATNKQSGKRGDITGPISKERAEAEAQSYQTYQWKKIYKYPKTAKYPYKSKK